MARSAHPVHDSFSTYLRRLGDVIGHADRHEPLRAYISGLLLPGERKSIEPIAARVDPGHVRSRHQSLHHFVTTAPWDELAVVAVARDWALAAMERHGVPTAWAIDDSGIPKKGDASVGVAHQYCGVLGKQENCQVAVSVSVVHPVMSVPAWWRLYYLGGQIVYFLPHSERASLSEESSDDVWGTGHPAAEDRDGAERISCWAAGEAGARDE